MLAFPKLTKIQWLRALMGHWELLYVLGDAAEKMADASVDTLTERWEIVKDTGDKVVPELEELFAELGLTGQAVLKVQSEAAVSLMSTEQELEAALLAGLRNAVMARCSEKVTALSEDDEKADELIAAAEATSRFDGKWLDRGISLAERLLPLLLPLLLKH